MVRNHQYSIREAFTSDATTAFKFGTAIVYNLNDTFAPGGTAVAHQPYGRDQMAAIYARYKVLRVLVRFEAISLSTSEERYFGILVNPPGTGSSLTAGTITGIDEEPLGIVATLPTRDAWVMTQLYDIGFLSGLTKSEFSNDVDTFSALAGASPSRLPTLQCALAANSNQPQTVTVRISFVFTTEWFERLDLAPS